MDRGWAITACKFIQMLTTIFLTLNVAGQRRSSRTLMWGQFWRRSKIRGYRRNCPLLTIENTAPTASQNKDEECLVCGETFNSSFPGEVWVQCLFCQLCSSSFNIMWHDIWRTDAMTHAKPVTSDAQTPWHMPNLWHCHSACRTFGSDWLRDTSTSERYWFN